MAGIGNFLVGQLRPLSTEPSLSSCAGVNLRVYEVFFFAGVLPEIFAELAICLISMKKRSAKRNRQAWKI